ncbi:hypothetical protein DFJ74DRAFT_704700 [Hyaloraphidium curvatum]|nr:hypothetical protein DFJ74DRAFT_704700 [Hyaloraphidium curvatum]
MDEAATAPKTAQDMKLVAVLTGSTNGIGRSSARRLAASGRVALLILGNRNSKAGTELAAELSAGAGGTEVVHEDLDLASLASVRTFAGRVRDRVQEHAKLTGSPTRVDLLVCNGGVGNVDGRTADGFEMQFGVNTLSHHLLSRLLEPMLLSAPGRPAHFYPRIVNVSSEGHYSSAGVRFDVVGPGGTPPKADLGEMFRRYADSKLGQVMLARSLSSLLNGSDLGASEHKPAKVATFSLHPGFVWTNGWSNAPWYLQSLLPVLWFFLRPFGGMLNEDEGSLPTLRCALDADAELEEAYESGLKGVTGDERLKVGQWWQGSYWDGLKGVQGS